MTASERLVIIGASYAGVQLAASARELGFEGPITLVGDEARLPYQRPPLSKAVLLGKTTVDQLALRGQAFFEEQRVDLLAGRRAVSLDRAGRSVRLADGAVLPYDWLALASGARSRLLPVPGAQLAGVFALRSVDDALQLLQALREVRRVCVIGGGFIGLEVASALRGRALEVSLVESRPRLLERNFPCEMGEYVGALHRSRGLALHLGRGVVRLHGTTAVEAVELDDGTRLPCDAVVVGIGVQPNIELAQQAGLAVDNGICTDGCGRTSDPRVLAAGDVAAMLLDPWGPSVAQPRRLRLESVQAANDGARAAASVIAGTPRPVRSVPWFWSDQYEHKFQMAGLHEPGDTAVVRGDMATHRFTRFYLRQGLVAAAHSVNRPAEHMLARKLIAVATKAAPAQLADESLDLRTLLPPA